MLLKTLRTKITIIFTLAAGLIYAAFALFLFAYYKGEIARGFDARLTASAKSIAAGQAGPRLLDDNTEIIRRVENEYYLITGRGDDVTIASLKVRDGERRPLDSRLIAEAFGGTPRFESVRYRGERYRALYYPLTNDKILHLGASLEETERQTALIRKLFIIFSPTFLGLLAFAGWQAAGIMVSPLVKVKELADGIRSGKTSDRIVIAKKGKEFDDLVEIFNEMLDGTRRSLEAQRRFTSDVSHEIRSPLTSLRGNIEVTLRKRRRPEEYEELLRSNLADIIRISRISDNLLLLSRADSNILEIRRQWFDLRVLLERVAEQLFYKARSAGVCVTAEYEEGIELSGDVDLLEQAFTNLLDNAIKYSPSGAEVRVTARRERAFVSVLFSDKGIGIPEKDVAHIFERFYRGDNTAGRGKAGTGLGLAITKWIVNAHGGKMEVRSVEGSGSDFIVRLPSGAPEGLS